MVGFARTALLFAVTIAISHAAPSSSSMVKRHVTTHRERAVDMNGNTVHAFQPLSSFETFGVDGLEHELSKRASSSVEELSTAFVTSRLGVSHSQVKVKSQFESEVTKHAFFNQVINGVPVANAVANVAINQKNNIASFGNSFVKPTNVAPPTPKLTAEEAITKAETALSGTYNQIPTTLEYFAKDDGSVVLTHVVQIENDEHFFEAFVDATTGDIVSANDFVAHLSYRVNPIQNQDPTTGFSLLVNPENPTSSPLGWVTGTDTQGNNAISFKGAQTATAVETSSNTFDYAFNASAAPTVANNVALAKVNAFYIVNSIHDITYLYGFTESAFNFQNNNRGLGGAGNDRITISVQDSAGTNNADFATPPDGQSGRMRMFQFTLTTPNRDGALSNDIVSHEATHGTTNRMTGGGTGRCLQTTEAGGMGEGWSDAFADWLEQKSAPIVDFSTGNYVLGTPNGHGVRSFAYSTNSTTNPLTYADLQTRTEVHDIGEVWANTLHNVHAALVAANGFSDTAKTDTSGTAGNVVFMHLFIDALPLQPCNPTFLTARNAWIQADANRFGGANTCVLWRAFASKGLGVNAANHVNDATVPSGC